MKASILYAVCNDQQPDELRLTVQSALEGIRDLDHEIIVVDDQSTDGCTRGLPAEVTVVRTRSRQGCTGSRKLLERTATGDVLVWSDPHCRYPSGALERLALAADRLGGIVQPKTRSMSPGSQVGYGAKYEINERGLAVPKSRQGVHPVHPGLIGTVYAVKKEVFDSIGGWPHLPGYWGCADTTLSLVSWALGVQTIVATDLTCIHKYSPDKTFCFSMARWHNAANAHWMHKALFPTYYSGFWRPHLLQHPKWRRPSVMKQVDHWLRSRRFREFAKFVADHRLPERTELACFKELLRRVPRGVKRLRENGQHGGVVLTGKVKGKQRSDAIDWLAGRLAGHEVRDALDVGAGDGVGMVKVAKRYPESRVRGLDLLPERVADMRERGLDAVEGNAQAMPFESESFDLVTCLHVLEHCPAPCTAMAELYRVLRPGGVALVIVPRESVPQHVGHLSCFPRERVLRALALEAGFGGLEFETVRIHNGQREIRMVARKPVSMPDGDEYARYVKTQVKIAPGREHKYVQWERAQALNWLLGNTQVKLGRVLDVGPRDGYIMGVLERHGAAVSGLELSPPAVEYARAHGHDVLQGDVRAMPFGDGEFDLVNCLHVLEHVPEPEAALREMWRVVKPGGYLYVVVPREHGEGQIPRRAHWAFFPDMDSVTGLMKKVADCEVQAEIGVIKRGVKEIRMAARKPGGA